MAPNRAFVVGTRGSRLALHQTDLVAQALRAKQPDLQLDILEIRTEGDRKPELSLTTIGGQGVFVKELESALHRREIDIAVHSLKDVPAVVGDGLVLAAFLPRADPRDALVTREGVTLAKLRSGARIGTGSQRRAVQLRALRNDLEPADIRGNVDTRVRKVDDGEYAAIVIAVAGLERLGLRARADEVFEPAAMLPAAGQGALAVEARADDAEALDLLVTIDDGATRRACLAERAFLARLGGGCRLPFGALATLEGDALCIRGFVSDETGAQMFRGETSGPPADAVSIGVRLAEELLALGASRFVETG